MTHRLYLRILERYRRAPPPWYAKLVRAAVSLAVAVLRRFYRFDFADRAIGGWWSIDRFRLELLLRWFEHESVERVRKAVRPGMTAIDVGAHFGYYTRLLSELVGPTGRVLAFEPSPENLAVLRRNLAGARYRNVEILALAVGDREDVLPLYVSPGNSNHSLVQGYTEAEAVVRVRCVTLDSIVEERKIERVDFVKSDTEGAEPMVLAGMLGTIARSPGIQLLLELNPRALRCGGSGPEEFLERLRGVGLDIEMVPADAPVREIYDNIWCVGTGGTGSPAGTSKQPGR